MGVTLTGLGTLIIQCKQMIFATVVTVPSVLFRTLPAIFAALTCTLGSAQLYETPESRRQAAEARKQAEETQRKGQTPALARGLQEKEAEAMEYVGKTYVYVPDPNAKTRVLFYEKLPPSSYSQDPEFLFTPLTTTTFVVTGVAMPPPVVYAIGMDEYLLRIRLPDGKEGYVNVVGPQGLKSHMTKGTGETLGEYVKEYVSSESPEVIIARENAAKEKAARELRLAREKADREQRAAEMKGAQERERTAAQRKREEQARKDAVAAQRAKPSPRIGMTQSQVINGTSWGGPNDINRTITAGGTREQWVYGNKRYLYFDNGILTAIQD